MKKLTLKQHWLISTIAMASGCIISMIEIMVNMLDANWWIQGVAVLLVAGGYIYHLKFVRCPECGARLRSGSTKFPEKCEVCGEDLAKYNK